MKRLLIIGSLLFLGACSQTITETDKTSKEVCTYDRTYNFWGNLKSEKLIVCGPRQ